MGVVHRRQPDGSWDGVPTRPYGADMRPHYRIRYFEVPPGRTTTLEQHEHDHGVVIQTGRARVTLGAERHEVGPGDVIYVAPNELHSFEALGDAPLGFICVAPPV
jgi:S-methyl-1-thioxylulose 5-phosphate methylthiotransferase